MKCLSAYLSESVAKVKLAKSIIDDVSKSVNQHFSFQSFISDRKSKKHKHKKRG